MTTIPSRPWPHDHLERQRLLRGLARLGLAEVIRVDGELRYRLLSDQCAPTPAGGQPELNVDGATAVNA